MRTFLSLKTCLLSALLLCVNSIAASKIISVSDFGLKPDSRINASSNLYKRQSMPCKQHPGFQRLFSQKEDMTSGHNMLSKKIITKEHLRC